jgi:hypothetical protein
MSYTSLLFTYGTQSLSNTCTMSREVEPDVYALPDAPESAGNGPRSGANDYLLPSGVVSLEHWLDLNA